VAISRQTGSSNNDPVGKNAEGAEDAEGKIKDVLWPELYWFELQLIVILLFLYECSLLRAFAACRERDDRQLLMRNAAVKQRVAQRLKTEKVPQRRDRF
jgi:hypothetical protein